jgi:hypothetical protein
MATKSSTSRLNINLNISCKSIVISSMQSPSTLPNHPPILSVNEIQKIKSLNQLKELEQSYDDFLDKNMQVLLLYNVVEDYLELRDALTIRISRLRREAYLRFHINKYYLEE